jgi:hypothetical protein
MTSEALAQLDSQQHEDGSWGQQATAPARIVPTILAARSVQEAGEWTPALSRALDFLAGSAVVDGGGSISGTRESVLTCYTGMLARLFLRAGRTDVAMPLLEWIVRYQSVAYGGTTYHEPSDHWGDYLQHRYGGCMASTTCLLGLVPAVSALALARRLGIEVGAEPLVEATRRLLEDRRVIYGRAGTVIPLAGRTKADPLGTRWLAPAFPLDYVVDLVELVQLAVDVDVPRTAMAGAIDLIQSWRLPDGGWPMLGKRRLAEVYRPESIDRKRSSALITARVDALGLELG